MTLASGGVLAELIGDAVTLLLPSTSAELEQALRRLKLFSLLDGFRGSRKANCETLIDGLQKLAVYVQTHAADIAEVEINPMFIAIDGVCAVDVSMRVTSTSALTQEQWAVFGFPISLPGNVAAA